VILRVIFLINGLGLWSLSKLVPQYLRPMTEGQRSEVNSCLKGLEVWTWCQGYHTLEREGKRSSLCELDAWVMGVGRMVQEQMPVRGTTIRRVAPRLGADFYGRGLVNGDGSCRWGGSWRSVREARGRRFGRGKCWWLNGRPGSFVFCVF